MSLLLLFFPYHQANYLFIRLIVSLLIILVLYTSKYPILPCHYRYLSVIRPHPLWLSYSISFITNFTSYADFQHEQTAGMYYYLRQMTSCTVTANQTSTFLPNDHSTTLVANLSSTKELNAQKHLRIHRYTCTHFE